MEPVKIGIIGAGNISDSYLKGAVRSKLIKVQAIADIRMEAAQAKAQAFGVEAVTVDRLLSDPEIELMVNLTLPMVHAEVSHQIISAGKHVYSEKPLTATFAEAAPVMQAARAKGLRVGGAPDTFLGAAHQAARGLVDAGSIGKPVGGAVTFMTRSSAHRYANPSFFIFKQGGGPMLDMGAYYLTQLINLLGPIKRVSAISTNGIPRREVVEGPLTGTVIDVEVPTFYNGSLEFLSGANVAISMSWEVHKHRRSHTEIYGTEGGLVIPDPNFFGGTPQVAKAGGDWENVDISAYPFGRPNRVMDDGRSEADYRMIGVVDMAMAIRHNRPHRANGDMAMHVLEVLEGFERSSVEGRHIAITTPCDRPAAVPQGADEEVFDA